MHAPKVIVEYVPAEQSTTPTVAPSLSVATATPAAPAAAEPQNPQKQTGRKHSVEEIDDKGIEQAEQATNEVVKPTHRRTVPSSRKSTTSTFFACEYDGFSPASPAAGDTLSVAHAPPLAGRADSATLPEDSPGWQAHRFVDHDKKTNVPPVPALPPSRRRTRTPVNANEPRILVVPRRESSLLPSAISSKLLPIALRQGDVGSASHFLSGYQHHNPSVPQDAVSVDSVECRSTRLDRTPSPPAHSTTASTDSGAEIAIAGTQTAAQPTSRGVSPPPVPVTPAGILGLQKTLTTTTPAAINRSTTALPPSPPRNQTEDTDAQGAQDARPMPRDGGSSAASSSTLSSQTTEAPRRTDSLRPSRAVERLKANRDTLIAPAPAPVTSSVPPTPGTALTQYLDMYTNAEKEGQEEGEGKDGPASTGSSSFSAGPSLLFGTSAAGRSPYSLYQGTTPGTGQCNSCAAAPSYLSIPSATTTAAAASPNLTSPDERPSSSKLSHPPAVPGAFNSHFRTRSVSDAPPISAFVPAKNTFDRRPSLPESSTPGATEPMSGFSNLLGSASSLPSAVGGTTVMERALSRKNSRSGTSLRSTESTRPTLPALNTNPLLVMKDLREDMFPHTPHSFSPEQPNLENILEAAEPPPAAAAAAATPPPAVVAPEPAPAPARPKTPADTRLSVLSGNLSRSFSSFSRGPMSSSSSLSFSRRDRTLPIGPRKPTTKQKGTEPDASRPSTATATAFSAESNATARAGSKAKPRDRSISVSAQTHSRTRTKSSASVVEKIVRPATPTFDTVQVQWRGLTLDAAKWMFSSGELHAMVGRAIRQSADPMCIRLLPIDLLDRDLPAALEDLEIRREEIKAKYTYQVRRRRTLMRGLAVGAEGGATPISVLKLVEELSECMTSCDRLSEELLMVSDQIAQIGRLRDGHSTSALAMVSAISPG